jgi:hypothetical protein
MTMTAFPKLFPRTILVIGIAVTHSAFGTSTSATSLHAVTNGRGTTRRQWSPADRRVVNALIRFHEAKDARKPLEIEAARTELTAAVAVRWEGLHQSPTVQNRPRRSSRRANKGVFEGRPPTLLPGDGRSLDERTQRRRHASPGRAQLEYNGPGFHDDSDYDHD